MGKEEVQVPFFIDDMILYVSEPENSTRTLLELIETFNKMAEYKIIKHQQLSYIQITSILRGKSGQESHSE